MANLSITKQQQIVADSSKARLMVEINNLRSSIFNTVQQLININPASKIVNQEYRKIQGHQIVYVDKEKRGEILKELKKQVNGNYLTAVRLVDAYNELGTLEYHHKISKLKKILNKSQREYTQAILLLKQQKDFTKWLKEQQA